MPFPLDTAQALSQLLLPCVFSHCQLSPLRQKMRFTDALPGVGPQLGLDRNRQVRGRDTNLQNHKQLQDTDITFRPMA